MFASASAPRPRKVRESVAAEQRPLRFLF